MPLMPVDLSELPAEVRECLKEELSQAHNQAVVDAWARQALIARHYFDSPPVWNDGVGPMKMSIDPVLLNCFRMRLGEEGYENEAMDWIAKKFEGLKVKAVSPKMQVGFREALARGPGRTRIVGEVGEREVKFRKSYC